MNLIPPTTTNLHYLAVVSRAAENNPDNAVLHTEAAQTLRGLINFFDQVCISESTAAQTQADLNTVARLANRTDAAAIARSVELIGWIAARRPAWTAYYLATGHL